MATTTRINYDNSGLSTGLAVAEVFANLERLFISNRKKVLATAAESGNFRLNAISNSSALASADRAAATQAFQEAGTIAVEEMNQSYRLGVSTVDNDIKKYERQGFNAILNPRNSTLLQRSRATILGVLSVIITSAIISSQMQFNQIISLVNPQSENIVRDIDNVQAVILKQGISGNIDTRRDMTSSAELNVRNESQKTLLSAEGERAAEYGIFLVQISAHPSACPLCVPWQTRVLVNDVYENGTADGKHELLSTAINAGLFHWNCRHNYITYVEKYSNKNIYDFDRASKEETALRYAFEQEQRYNERMIRQWKREAVGSLTPERQVIAEAKVREWQAKQRGLINLADERGITLYRQSEREQIGGETRPTIRPEVLGIINR